MSASPTRLDDINRRYAKSLDSVSDPQVLAHEATSFIAEIKKLRLDWLSQKAIWRKSGLGYDEGWILGPLRRFVRKVAVEDSTRSRIKSLDQEIERLLARLKRGLEPTIIIEQASLSRPYGSFMRSNRWELQPDIGRRLSKSRLWPFKLQYHVLVRTKDSFSLPARAAVRSLTDHGPARDAATIHVAKELVARQIVVGTLNAETGTVRCKACTVESVQAKEVVLRSPSSTMAVAKNGRVDEVRGRGTIIGPAGLTILKMGHRISRRIDQSGAGIGEMAPGARPSQPTIQGFRGRAQALLRRTVNRVRIRKR